MGVTILNKNKCIDMGCGGFSNLRNTIAGLLPEEFAELYKAWTNPMNWLHTDSPNHLLNEEGNKRLSRLYAEGILTDEDDPVIDFLFAPDCGGKISAKGCKRLYQVIKDYDDDIVYGYSGRSDCAKFADFKAIVEECAKKRLVLTWR